MLELDGSQGEGGGQVLRTALTLSLLSGEPFELKRVRAGRARPGLRAQHLTCVEAAAQVGRARVEGARLGSERLSFRPQALCPGDYTFDLGTAGSTSLVLQTILPALARAEGPSSVLLRGGTHNPLAPPFEFLSRVYLPLLERIGPRVEASLLRAGFFPKGGGRVRFGIWPAPWKPLELIERGPLLRQEALALVAGLPEKIAHRELAVVQRGLGWPPERCQTRVLPSSQGPGNALLLTLEYASSCEVISAFGQRGVPAERVAQAAVQEAQTYLRTEAPVGVHLADQLLLLLAIAGGGRFRTLPCSGHTRTQLALIPRFLQRRIEERVLSEGVHELEVLS